MSLLQTVVKIADGVTNSLGLQSKVGYRRWLGNENGYGDENLNPKKTLRAVVEYKQKTVVTAAGQEVNSNASVLFIDLPALMLATSNQGMTTQDEITLPDGTTAPILALDGFVDPKTGAADGRPVYTQVYLG
jgi:hypothetical protein